MNVSFAQLRISASLGIGPAAYGFGAACFSPATSFSSSEQPFSAAHRRANCMSLILLLWGVVSASTAFVRNEWDFYVLRFLLGACEAGFFPGVILDLTWWYPASVRARVVAVFLTAIPVAGLLGGPVSGWILENVRGRGFHDWQWLFILLGRALPSRGALGVPLPDRSSP